MSDVQPKVELACTMQATAAAAVYARAGRVHIADALSPPSAQRAWRCLSTEVDWQMHFNEQDKVFDLSAAQVAALSPDAAENLRSVIHRGAATGFQYLFENYPLSDLYALGQDRELYVMRIYEFLNSSPFLEFARRLTGVESIGMADAQATRYGAGHFLTCHDDRAEGKQRVAAYVLNLSPYWRTDWGGILQFIDNDGHVSEGYTPRFNALNVFRVPQRHSVSCIAPFAAAPRFSISGWLRRA